MTGLFNSFFYCVVLENTFHFSFKEVIYTFLWIFTVFLESDTTKDSAIEELQKQINDIVQELNLLKEQQALQTGKASM